MATTASAATAPPASAFHDDVQAELVRYLYRQAPGSIVALLLVGGILAFVLRNVERVEPLLNTGLDLSQNILGWLIALVLVNSLRAVQIGAFFRRNPPNQGISRWAVASAAGSALNGIVWAAPCFLFLDPAKHLTLITITVILMGVAVGAVVNLASYMPSFWVVVAPPMISLIAVLIKFGDDVSTTVALLAAIASAAYVVGARIVHRLLTESLQLSFENLALRRKAEEANVAKTRFLAAASHDLRQPIHALGLLFATLSERTRDEGAAPLLKQIDGAVDAVDSMLTSLLDISKLDAGVVHPDVSPIDLAALLERLDDEHQAIAGVTGNNLVVRSPRSAAVLTDAAMLHRILANLVSNALRYTANGHVLVGARRRGSSIRIEVYDTGPGIPSDALEDIFLEFHQLGNPERDRRKGLGLGLAIVKRLAGLLGHPIDVRSTVGRGSRFSVTLPLSEVPRPRAATQVTVAPPGADLHGKRVLVLDDDAAVLDAMRGLLERWGCDVITTSSPEEAEASLASDAGLPDMLIVDYRLRGLASGIETIRRLHQLAGHSIPALVITGDTAPDRLREAEESGYALLHKPVKAAQLRAVIRELLLPMQTA